MNFKRYQFLRDRALEKLRAQDLSRPMVATPDIVQGEDSLMLAYIGDALYSLFVRQRLIGTGIDKVRVLHALVTEFICAKAQAAAILALEPRLTDEELAVAKRARNSHVNVPKSATVQEYRASTAFEALLGYLSRTGQEARLQELMMAAFEVTLAAINTPVK